jgi:hypothetical protein
MASHDRATKLAFQISITHLPDCELMGGDVVEYRLDLRLDCVLQVTDSLRRRYVNQKGVGIVKAENPAGERDFGVHVCG